MEKELTRNIFIAFTSGIIFGILLNVFKDIHPELLEFINKNILSFGGDIFLTLLKMLVVPIVFFSLVCGVCGLNDLSSLKRISLKTISLYLLTTAVAITLAVSVAYVLDPGSGKQINVVNQTVIVEKSPSIIDVLLNIIPQNPFKSLVEGNMLQVIFFALLIGSAISMSGTNGNNIKNFFISFNSIILKALNIIMAVAPLGIFCLISKTFSTQGLEVILELAKYFFTVILVLILHTVFFYGSLTRIIGKVSPLVFFTKIKDAIFFAFSTSSSSATIPVTLNNVVNNLKVKNRVASFTVPLGATINMDGTAIMQGVATIFISNIYGFSLDINDFITIILTATLASIGTAGVPGVGMIMLGMVLSQVGLPLEGIAIVSGVDRFLDMLRTATNVSGDAMVSLIIDKSEK